MRTLLGILLTLLFGISLPASSPAINITALYGGAVVCDPALPTCTAIPLTTTILCTVTCPLRVSPSYASSTEFWAALGQGTGNCVRSTDGGLTWPACTTQPFGTGANELYAGAADGSVIAFGTTTGPNTCTASRSTNNGTTWGVTFTLVADCNPGNTGGQYLYCLGDGRCEVATGGGAGLLYRIFRSANNGQSWTVGETATSFCSANAGSAWDGSAGIIPPENPGCGGGNLTGSFIGASDTWSLSAVWNGTQGDCAGSVVYNGVGRAICQGAGAAPDNRYTMRSSTGANVASLTLPNALVTSIDAGGQAISPFTNTLYLMAQNTTGNTSIWLSRDNLSTFTQLSTFTGSATFGHMFYSGGCVYFVFNAPSRFGKICV